MDAVDYEFPVDAKVSMTFPSPRPRGCCEDYAAYFDRSWLHLSTVFTLGL